MRRNKIYFLSLLISFTFLLFECCKSRSKSATTSTQTTADSDSLYLMLDQSPCFGMCPTFVVNIYKSGYALYIGKMSVDRIGTYEARFTKDQIKLFDQAVMDNRVDTLQSEYVNPYIADFPASYSSVVINGKRHTFHVSTDTPPESLAEFHKSITRLIELAQWKKISDKTE